ncbi:MAG: hypothetical protein LBK69_04910 [Syntrophomonadaceae bacterium]|nr:hypothetical protein [Syntrophomonadaceae bacterium]
MKLSGKKVMIGCPVRDRAWILPRYLESIRALDYPPDLLEFCFIINDCSDNTPELLKEFAAQEQRPARLVHADSFKPGPFERGLYSFKRLAELRNILIGQFLLSSCDYLFSIDSDIAAASDSLNKLVQSGKDIVSALVWNGGAVNSPDIYNILQRDGTGRYIHIKSFPPETVFPVDCTGAAYLIKRWVLERAHVKYNADHGAEDIGFCKAAQQAGAGIFCHSGVRCFHYMKKPQAIF